MNRLAGAQELAPNARALARDPFALELIKNALVALADEMALTVYRTARSFVVKEALDFSTALFLADGQLIAQGTCLPFHLGAMPFAVKAVQRRVRRAHPARATSSSPTTRTTAARICPDIVLVKPIFVDGALFGFSVALAHMTDIGGRIPGGNASDSTEIYQEGLRIPPSRLWREGEPDETMFRLIERNVRVPDKVLGDIRSLVAACVVGEREMQQARDALRHDGVRAALPRPPRLHGAVHARGDREASEGHVALRRLPRRRRRRSRPDPHRGRGDDSRGQHDDRPHRIGAAGARRDQLRVSVHAVHRARLRALHRRSRDPEQRRLLPSDRGDRARRARSSIRACLPRWRRAASRAFASPTRSSARSRRRCPTCCRHAARTRPTSASRSAASMTHGESHVYLEFLLASWGGGPDRDGMDACTGHARELLQCAGRDDRGGPADRGRALRDGARIPAARGAFAADLRSSAIFASRATAARCRSARTGATIRRTDCRAGSRARRRTSTSCARTARRKRARPSSSRPSIEATCCGSAWQAAAATATR